MKRKGPVRFKRTHFSVLTFPIFRSFPGSASSPRLFYFRHFRTRRFQPLFYTTSSTTASSNSAVKSEDTAKSITQHIRERNIKYFRFSRFSIRSTLFRSLFQIPQFPIFTNRDTFISLLLCAR